ncbi:cytochrome C [Rhodoferax koreense]|uniref:Cytochrome C n=2 Tax=Rhodoferax koreensis TaxID=1842727 RepID=A0A1P8K3G0_9BURK|nr:cytochrome C [Rhodoferax koreense]
MAGLWPVLACSANEPTPQQKAQDYGCFSCHGLVHKQVGPGFAQVAERYRNDPAMPAQLAAKIRSGSVGTWGRVIMPRQPKVSEADARLLAIWVLSQPAP